MAEAFKGVSGCFNKEIFVCFRLVQLRSAKERENNLAILYINTVDYLHTLFCLLKQQCIKVINQQERAMSVFVNGFYVGHEVYPGVFAEERVGQQWMIRKQDDRGWPCRVGEVKINAAGSEFLACNCRGDVKGRASNMRTAVRYLLS
jgi:hypothetical protein